MPDDRPYTDVDYSAEQVLIAHQRDGYRGCLCGWDELGRSHPLHVWRELQRAVLPDHDARVRADERARVAEEIGALEVRDERELLALDRAAAIARAHATTPTTEEDHHGA